MSCTCQDCIAILGIKTIAGGRRGNGGGGGLSGLSSPVITINDANAGRGLNKEARLDALREEAVSDDVIPRLNPPFPYRVIQPDFSYFRFPANPPDKTTE